MTGFFQPARWRAAIVLLLAVSLLVGCEAASPPTGQPGLDAISPDGTHALLLHVPSGSPQLAALNLKPDVETISQPDVFTQSVDPYPHSSFSPNGRYLIYRSPTEWRLREIADRKETTLGANTQIVEFLPDGTLLFIEGTTNQIALRLSDPDTYGRTARQPLASGRYVFVSTESQMIEIVQRTALSTGGTTSLADLMQRATQLSQIENLVKTLPVSMCPHAIEPSEKAWVLVNSSKSVSRVVATSARTRAWELDAAHSTGLLSLLETQSSRYRAQLASEAERLEAEVRQKAAEASQQISDAQVKAQVEAQIADAVWTKVIFSILGLANPDGSKLLLVLLDPDSSELIFSLYLVPLDSNEPPITLAEKSDWLPTFHFSPDGSQILFESNRDGARGYYLANSDGSNMQRLPIDNATNLCWN